ncbi:uncharacterized protein LOC117075312 isoform X7 [Trachypithecus francoisi]|uniref:uncharacterized protein LOC117075312 isoform X7 n=1 Tax=Trachypithecus francoisi TaxID=54180 RepID=UPI00141BDECE|nr:uncharacterized protein LOC117075312 isoform X7 [Trachypithecus francoisi]
MWHLQSSSQISASSCPSTLSTNISFTKLGGSSVYISGPVTEAWTERPGEECFLWSFDRHNYLSLPQKLRGCSADISDPRRYRKRLVWESPGALHDQVFSRHHVTLRMDVTCWRKQKAETLMTSQSCQNSS